MKTKKFPWRPRKVDPKSSPYYEIVMKLSQDQYDMFQGYGNGQSMEDLARGFMCNKATISREFRRIIKGATKI